MYKITLWDVNFASGGSGTFSCYCDDIDKFEEEWTKLEKDASAIERFRRSKAGEVVTDYFSDNEELNIVQEDKDAKVFFEKDIVFENKEVHAENFWGYISKFFVKHLCVHIKYVKFRDEYLRLMSFSIRGIVRCNNGMKIVKEKYIRGDCYGNPVLKCTHASDDIPYSSDDISIYDNTCIESIVYYPMGCTSSFEEIKECFDSESISDEEIAILFYDIVGE